MRRWWSKVTRWRKALRQLRNPVDLFLFLRILFFAAAVPLLLRLKPLRVQSLLEPKHVLTPPEEARIHKIARYVYYALQLSRPLVRPGCLTRGLTLYYFLSRAGLDVTLCFGMGKVDGEFVGHCWLVKDQEPFMEARDPRPIFSEVYSIPRGVPISGTQRLTYRSQTTSR